MVALHPRMPSAAAAWAPGAGTALVELDEGWRRVGATEVAACVDWLAW